MRIYILLFSLTVVTACTNPRPNPLFLETDVPGTPEYNQGWKHGCESGLSTYGTAIQKMTNRFYQDYRMLDNPDYNAAWHESFDYCRHYNYKWQSQDFYQGILN